MPVPHLLAVGPFGEAVAERLAALLNITTGPPDATALPPADAYLLAAWRPVPELAELLDEVAFARGIPWVPVVLDHPRLRLGPAWLRTRPAGTGTPWC